jgi:Spy/CpxP family protein refolding chaperone
MERFLFPPELVMRHQGEIGLQDSQRATLSSAMQQAQAKFVDTQWKLSAEGEKLSRLLQSPSVDETQVLEQVDRILALEREMKRAQMTLMLRVKNTLTAAQQDKLRQLREGELGARGNEGRRPEEPEAPATRD